VSEDIAHTSDGEGGGAGVVAAFVVGGLIATAVTSTVMAYGKIRSKFGERKARREQERAEKVAAKTSKKK